MRPKILDLFCGAGGCAKGYHDAGFDVVGIDHVAQPNYPFEFIKADALMWMDCLFESTAIMRGEGYGWRDGEGASATGGCTLDDFAAIHASPPCQAFSIANNIHGRTDHPDLIEATRQRLIASGLPYVIENVPGAPLKGAVVVCGLSLGLRVRRHRLFESNRLLFGTQCPHGEKSADYLIVFGNAVEMRGKQVGRTAKNGPIMRRKRLSAREGGEAMGIDWMTRNELSQAIPPAYTEYIGKQLLAALDAGAG